MPKRKMTEEELLNGVGEEIDPTEMVLEKPDYEEEEVTGLASEEIIEYDYDRDEDCDLIEEEEEEE